MPDGKRIKIFCYVFLPVADEEILGFTWRFEVKRSISKLIRTSIKNIEFSAVFIFNAIWVKSATKQVKPV